MQNRTRYLKDLKRYKDYMSDKVSTEIQNVNKTESSKTWYSGIAPDFGEQDNRVGWRRVPGERKEK